MADQGGPGGPGPPLELGIYRVKFLKIHKISFFLLLGPPLGKNRSSAPAYDKFLILPAGLLLQASKASAGGGPMNDEGMGVIPAQTQLSTSLSLNLGMAGKTVSVFSNWSKLYLILTIICCFVVTLKLFVKT